MTLITKNTADIFLGNIPGGKTYPFFELQKNKAVQILQEQGLPRLKEEEYKYTPITKRIENAISNYQIASPIHITPEEVARELVPGMESEVLVFNNGNFDPKLSSWNEDNFRIALLSETVD